ncbi:tumor necrosis factor receptor superfamily member 14-like [Triplophysa rosa]|uniref:tumor necrosis factor receptor superfamily member 14-like n=1 Tax=Triplophysa rosa TaxID=992332 RepID=UPI00254624D9|nr:tumor necrosis factor receptor superfamily member 14-like [Triplophysa rosa]
MCYFGMACEATEAPLVLIQQIILLKKKFGRTFNQGILSFYQARADNQKDTRFTNLIATVSGEECKGNRVYWHCTQDTSTTCVPCLESTYTDHPNGLIQCLSCSVCDAGKGLRARKSCTHTADVLCEPQEGFYCIDKNKYSCTLAVKHSECRPGQYIKQADVTLRGL